MLRDLCTASLQQESFVINLFSRRPGKMVPECLRSMYVQHVPFPKSFSQFTY